jgi:hypothetical protein
MMTQVENSSCIPWLHAVASLEQPRISVRVSNLPGRPLSPDQLTLTLRSATRVGHEAVVLSKKKFELISGDRTSYSVKLMEKKAERVLHKLCERCMAKSDPRHVGNVGALLDVKVTCAVGVEKTEIWTVDADQTTQAKLTK